MYHLALHLDAEPFLGLHNQAAFQWMLKSAEAGHPQACMVLSLTMADKKNPQYNLAEALKWAIKTAWLDPGHVLDEQVPAILEEVRKRAEEVNSYYQAAERGEAEAQFQMGHVFHSGYCVDADTVAAKEWWSKAAGQGHEGARQMLQTLEEA